MIVIQSNLDFINTEKKFTELAALYYAAKYADDLIKGDGTVFIFKTGHIYDIAVVSKIRTENITTIKDKAEFFIEVKGTKNTDPPSIRVCNTYEKLTNKIKQKYLFYIIYNIGLNKIPGITIFDWAHFIKRSHIGYDKTYHILNVHKDVKNGLIFNSRNAFKSLDTYTKNIILRSFKEGKMLVDTKRCSYLSEQTYVKNQEVPTIQERNNTMEHSAEKMYEDLLKFIRSLGNDIIEEQEIRRLSFSSISKRNNRKQKLLWIYQATLVGWTVYVRKESLHDKYPEIIKEISEYVDGNKSKNLHYPYFKINTIDDLTKAKIIIKFAYDKL